MIEKSELTIFTIGHSTRKIDEFIELIQAYNITLLIDVRTAPYSRHNPQFNKEVLPNHLKLFDVKYIHLPEIGGLRHSNRDSVNLALKNASFRGYADYMQNKEFNEPLLKIITLARENVITLMCAEALPWKCHRILISDALIVRKVKVLHIISKSDTITHRISELAHVDGVKVSYPLYLKESPQRTLGDFGAG